MRISFTPSFLCNAIDTPSIMYILTMVCLLCLVQIIQHLLLLGLDALQILELDLEPFQFECALHDLVLLRNFSIRKADCVWRVIPRNVTCKSCC